MSQARRLRYYLVYGGAALAAALSVIESIAFRTVAYVVGELRTAATDQSQMELRAKIAKILHDRADDNQMLSSLLMCILLWYGSAELLPPTKRLHKICRTIGHITLLVTAFAFVFAVILEGNIRVITQMRTITEILPWAYDASKAYFLVSLLNIFLMARALRRKDVNQRVDD